MADIFISYSKKHARLTVDLARDLEAEGYTTWWDYNLRPGDPFPKEIARQIDYAKAVIVIWTESSVGSDWVQSEAAQAHGQNKLMTVRDAALDLSAIPHPFKNRHTSDVTDRRSILAALASRGIHPSNAKSGVASAERSFFGSLFGGASSAAPTGVSSGRSGNLRPGESFRDLDIAPEMVVLPPGEFLMGSKDGEGDDDERPQHKVTIRQAFAVGKYPVTFAEWDAAVAQGGVSHKPRDQGWGRGRRPVIDVSWDDAQAYVKWLAQKTAQPYRLLSEAEWEYACRAGTETADSFGDSITKAQAAFWERGLDSAGKTVEVGSFPANRFGLHDMHGNVWEWCQDCWNDNYRGAPSDGSAWTASDRSRRVLRGGSWLDFAQDLRAANRDRNYPDDRVSYLGFRLARTLNP